MERDINNNNSIEMQNMGSSVQPTQAYKSQQPRQDLFPPYNPQSTSIPLKRVPLPWQQYLPSIHAIFYIDLILTAGFLALNIVWIIYGISLTFAILAGLHFLHSFSWFIGLALVYRVEAKSYTLFYTVVYVISSVIDILILIPRIIIPLTCSPGGCNFTVDGYSLGPIYVSGDLIYMWISLGVNIAWIVIDIWASAVGVQTLKKVIKWIDEQSVVLSHTELGLKTYKPLYEHRGALRGLFVLELAFAIGIIILVAVGFYVTDLYAWLTFGVAIHLFLWVGIRAVAGTPDIANRRNPDDGIKSKTYVTYILLLSILSMLVDGASVAWRLIILIQCLNSGTCSSTSFESTVNLILSWLIWALNLFLLIISIVYVVYIVRIRYFMHKDLMNKQVDLKKKIN